MIEIKATQGFESMYDMRSSARYAVQECIGVATERWITPKLRAPSEEILEIKRVAEAEIWRNSFLWGKND